MQLLIKQRVFSWTDSYDVYVSVVPQKQEFASITIANNGTGYDTGEWRATASYVDKKTRLRSPLHLLKSRIQTQVQRRPDVWLF